MVVATVHRTRAPPVTAGCQHEDIYIYIDLGTHIAYIVNELLFIFRCITVCRLTGSWICWYVKLRQDALEHDMTT